MKLLQDIFFYSAIILSAILALYLIDRNTKEKQYMYSVILACINERAIMLKAPEEKDTVIVLCKRI